MVQYILSMLNVGPLTQNCDEQAILPKAIGSPRGHSVIFDLCVPHHERAWSGTVLGHLMEASMFSHVYLGFSMIMTDDILNSHARLIRGISSIPKCPPQAENTVIIEP